MDVIRFLESYEGMMLTIKSKYDAYITQHADIGTGAIVNDGMPHGNAIGSRTETDAIRLNEKYQSLLRAVNKAYKRFDEIELMIEEVSSYKGQYVLRERYLCFRPIDEIGYDNCINRTGRTARKYHDQAISELERMYGDAQTETLEAKTENRKVENNTQ